MHFEPQKRLAQQFEKTNFKRIGTEPHKDIANVEKKAGTTTIKFINNIKEIIKDAPVATTAEEVAKNNVITTEVQVADKEEPNTIVLNNQIVGEFVNNEIDINPNITEILADDTCNVPATNSDDEIYYGTYNELISIVNEMKKELEEEGYSVSAIMDSSFLVNIMHCANEGMTKGKVKQIIHEQLTQASYKDVANIVDIVDKFLEDAEINNLETLGLSTVSLINQITSKTNGNTVYTISDIKQIIDEILCEYSDDYKYRDNAQWVNGSTDVSDFIKYMTKDMELSQADFNYIYNHFFEQIIGGALGDIDISVLMELSQDMLVENMSSIGIYTTAANALLSMETNDNNIYTLTNAKTLFNEILANLYNETTYDEQIVINDLTNASTETFLSELFGNKTRLTISDIMNNESSWLESNDPGVQGIIQALYYIAEKYNIHNEDDYEKFLNLFITMIYEQCDQTAVKSNGKPVLTKKVLEKYFNKGNTLEDLKNFILSGLIDDKVDNFHQGITGDCWLLSALLALKASDRGQEIIADAITNNENGTWTVRLYIEGAPVTYTFSIDDILDAKNSGKYSRGDLTLILFELAVSKLREEFVDKVYNDNLPGDMYLNSGSVSEMLKYLIGDINQTYWALDGYNDPEKIPEQVQEIKNWFFEHINNGSIEPGTVGNYMIMIGFNRHDYSVTGVDENGIYYVNPWDSSTTLFMSWEEFAEFIPTKAKFMDFSIVELPE